MNAEFFEAIEELEKEKGIPRDYMYDKIRQAMLAAFRRDNPNCEDNVEIILDEDKKRIEMVVNKTVVVGFAREISDRIFFIDDGVIKEENTPEELFNNPKDERLKVFLSKIISAEADH